MATRANDIAIETIVQARATLDSNTEYLTLITQHAAGNVDFMTGEEQITLANIIVTAIESIENLLAAAEIETLDLGRVNP